MIERRVGGTEMEWGLRVEWANRPDDLSSERERLSVAAHAGNASMPELYALMREHMPADMPHIKGPNGYFLANGVRLYNDHKHPEYATPEIEFFAEYDSTEYGKPYDGLDELVAAELAGEGLLLEIYDGAVRAGMLASFILSNRVVDAQGNSWGFHEGYLVDRKRISPREHRSPEFHKAFYVLGLHLATRSMYTGSGAVVYTSAGKPYFVTSQKFVTLSTDYSSETVREKPLVNTKDEPHADRERFARLHVVSGDPNLSPWAKRMKIGTTALILSALEDGYTLSNKYTTTEDLYQFAQRVSRDINCEAGMRNIHGEQVSAVEIQQALFTMVKDHTAQRRLSRGEQWVLAEWERTISVLKQNPFLLVDRADWPLRYGLYYKGGAAAAELTIDRVTSDPKLNKLRKLRNTRWKDWMPPEGLVTFFRHNPPANTRAHPRSKFIRENARRKNGDVRVEWDHWVDYWESAIERHQVLDPRDTEVEAVPMRRF